MGRRWMRVARWGSTVATVVALTLGAGASAAQAASYARITGSGSTWAHNALAQWSRNVAANYGMQVNYSGVGATAARHDFIQGTVDYAVSELPFQTRPEDGSVPEVPSRGYTYLPFTAGGTALMYHLRIDGRQVTDLRLSGEVITKIFTGAITRWNHPAIQADNPGLAMPDKAITPVVRSDGNGSSAQFSLWMSKQHGDIWTAGMRSQFPTPANGRAQPGSHGVSGYVQQGYGEGAITYVENSYALAAGFPVAKVLNSSGYYTEPTASAVAVALSSARVDTGAPVQILDDVYDSPDPRAYPLSSYAYLIAPTQTGGVFTEDDGRTLGTFASYALCEGQQQAESLGYSPLPRNLVLAGFDQIRRIPGAGGANVDPDSCNNPTFKPGDTLTSTQLLRTAPQPPACDKRGPQQCGTGTAEPTGSLSVRTTAGSSILKLDAGVANAATTVVPRVSTESGEVTLPSLRLDAAGRGSVDVKIAGLPLDEDAQLALFDPRTGVMLAWNTFRLTAPLPPFVDVSASRTSPLYSEFAAQISWLANAGISTGWGAGSSREFRPYGLVTRDAMAAFLYRYAAPAGYEPPADPIFDDVPTSNPFYTQISWLASTGIATGWTEDGRSEFRPFAPITRDAMAAFLYRFAKRPAVTLPSTPAFADVPTTNGFYREISWLAGTGISTGWTEGGTRVFRPYADITRDAMAAFLSRYDDLPSR